MIDQWNKLKYWKPLAIEVYICAVSALIWFLNPYQLMKWELGLYVEQEILNLVKPLLYSRAQIVVCCYCVLLGLLIHTRPYHVPERVRTLVYLSLVMTCGDVFEVMMAYLTWAPKASTEIVLIKIFLASLCGVMRLPFIMEYSYLI